MYSPYAVNAIMNSHFEAGEEHLTLQLSNAIASNDQQRILKWMHLGARINHTDANGDTPLHAALNLSNYDLVPFLIELGAGVGITDIFGITPLHVAAFQLHGKSVRTLIEAGASPVVADNNKQTPLHSAVVESLKLTTSKPIENAKRVIKILLAADKKKQLFYCRDNTDKMALDYALAHPKHAITELLLLKKTIDDKAAQENQIKN
jgi:ankyrin repeat protein